MNSIVEEVYQNAHSIVTKYNLVLDDVINVNDYGMNIIRVLVDDEISHSVDVDVLEKINLELLDLVDSILPDGTYLEVSSVGIERELKNDKDIVDSIGKYIYVSCYQKIETEKDKEFYGDLLSYENEVLTLNVLVKQKRKLVAITKSNIAKIRLAVKF